MLQKYYFYLNKLIKGIYRNSIEAILPILFE